MTPQEPMQVPLTSLPDQLWDVIVVGAGPAGSIAALYLASAGRKVLLMDRKRFPREKACGDSLPNGAQAALRRAGLLESVKAVGRLQEDMTVVSPSEWSVTFPVNIISVERSRLDTILAGAAAERGAVFCHGKAIDIDAGSDHAVVQVEEPSLSIRCRVVVVATGIAASLAAKTGAASASRPRGAGIRCYVRCPERRTGMVIDYHRTVLPGYAWVIPLDDETYNIGCGIMYRGRGSSQPGLAETFRRWTSASPYVRGLLERAEAVGPALTSAIRCALSGLTRNGPGNVLVAGDTVGTSLPFTGEGVGPAMIAGEVAAGTINDAFETGDTSILRTYPDRLRGALGGRYPGYFQAEKWLCRPWFNNFMVQRAASSERLRRSLTGIMNEEIDPSSILSLRGAIKALVT